MAGDKPISIGSGSFQQVVGAVRYILAGPSSSDQEASSGWWGPSGTFQLRTAITAIDHRSFKTLRSPGIRKPPAVGGGCPVHSSWPFSIGSGCLQRLEGAVRYPD